MGEEGEKAGQSLKQVLESVCKDLAFVSINEERKPLGAFKRD